MATANGVSLVQRYRLHSAVGKIPPPENENAWRTRKNHTLSCLRSKHSEPPT